MYKIIRFFLFLLPPEKAHNFTLFIGKHLSFLWRKQAVTTDTFSIMGIEFPSKLGLAAGLDKNGTYIDFLAAGGFGFIEIGTVTPKPQKGNPKPRLFRIKKYAAIVNRMGFNNQGMEQVYRNIKSSRGRRSAIIGVNIGKNKSTSNEEAYEDYLLCFDKFYNIADYFVVNVSSPNTQGLRKLQEKEALQKILQQLESANFSRSKTKLKPILIKIAPDLKNSQLDDIVYMVNNSSIAGIIATNTTIDKNLLDASPKAKLLDGGLSGKPLCQKSTDTIKYIRTKLKKEKVIIGVGGIFSANDAREKIEAGADLVQVYTGFVYKGFQLVRDIKASIDRTSF